MYHNRCIDNILYSAFVSNSEDVNGLHCKTEKDKIKLHDLSAGMCVCKHVNGALYFSHFNLSGQYDFKLANGCQNV